MRTLFYWLTSTVIAVLAAGASEFNEADAELNWAAPSQADVLLVPEPSRALLLGIGIMAIAYTYRQAWMNWKRRG